MAKRDTWTPEQRARERATKAKRKRARGQINPGIPYRPRVPRGPSGSPPTPHLADGLELAGQSIRSDANGNVSGTWDLGRRAGDANPKPIPPDFSLQRIARATRNGDEILRWETHERAKAESFTAFKQALRDELEQYRGVALAVPAPEETWRDFLSCYWWGDPHIGMLAHAIETLSGHYDLKIAEAQLIECFRQLVWRTPPSRVGRIVNLGDFYHAETNTQTTPGHGNKLDVDGRAYKVQKTGLRVLRAVIDLAKQRHQIVEFVALPGNHDPNMAFQIAAWLAAVYENDPRVVVDESIAAYNYREFGENLIATCHGDGAKEGALPLLLATRQRESWGRTKYHQFHAGHIHHTRKIEHSGCLTWYHNTLADKDAWHAFKGYDAEQFLESTTYHERFGPEGSAQVGIERVRAALASETSVGTPT